MKKKKINYLNLILLITMVLLIILQMIFTISLFLKGVNHIARIGDYFSTMTIFLIIYITVDLIWNYLENYAEKKTYAKIEAKHKSK